MANTPPRSAGRIPDDEWDAATARAEQKGETITDVIRRALKQYSDPKCKYCQLPIEYFKGYWWTGNDFMCPDGESAHVPEEVKP